MTKTPHLATLPWICCGGNNFRYICTGSEYYLPPTQPHCPDPRCHHPFCPNCCLRSVEEGREEPPSPERIGGKVREWIILSDNSDDEEEEEEEDEIAVAKTLAMELGKGKEKVKAKGRGDVKKKNVKTGQQEVKKAAAKGKGKTKTKSTKGGSRVGSGIRKVKKQIGKKIGGKKDGR